MSGVALLPSLTSLKINFAEDCWPPLPSQFPQLVSLEVTVGDGRHWPDWNLVKHCAPRLVVDSWRASCYELTRLTALRELALRDSGLIYNTEKLELVLPALTSLTSLAMTCKIKDKPTLPRFVRSVAHMLVAILLPTRTISSELADALYMCPKLRRITEVGEPSFPLLLPLADRLNAIEFATDQHGVEAFLKHFSSLTVLHTPFAGLPPQLRMPRLVELKIHCDWIPPELDFSCFPSLLRLHIDWDEYALLAPIVRAAEQRGVELVTVSGRRHRSEGVILTKLSSELRWLTLSL